MTAAHDVDEGYLYLPTLDYAAQKFGPDSKPDVAAFAEFERQLATLAAICSRRGCALTVTGDYEITPVEAEPVRPNVALRKAGLFRTRTVAKIWRRHAEVGGRLVVAVMVGFPDGQRRTYQYH